MTPGKLAGAGSASCRLCSFEELRSALERLRVAPNSARPRGNLPRLSPNPAEPPPKSPQLPPEPANRLESPADRLPTRSKPLENSAKRRQKSLSSCKNCFARLFGLSRWVYLSLESDKKTLWAANFSFPRGIKTFFRAYFSFSRGKKTFESVRKTFESVFRTLERLLTVFPRIGPARLAEMGEVLSSKEGGRQSRCASRNGANNLSYRHPEGALATEGGGKDLSPP
jgi:hypothetical protein